LTLDPLIAPPGSHIRFCEPPYRTRAGWIGRQPLSKCKVSVAQRKASFKYGVNH
jgi:hypothetical protein